MLSQSFSYWLRAASNQNQFENPPKNLGQLSDKVMVLSVLHKVLDILVNSQVNISGNMNSRLIWNDEGSA